MSCLSRRAALHRLFWASLALGVSPRPSEAQALVKAWPAGRPTPALALPDLHGTVRRSSEWVGKVVVINFWASWCEPCVAEMPSLLRLAEARADRGVVVVAVNYQEGSAKIRTFLETVLGEVPESLLMLLDRDGAAARAWTPRVFPSTVILDRQGRARWLVVGEMDWAGEAALALVDRL